MAFDDVRGRRLASTAEAQGELRTDMRSVLTIWLFPELRNYSEADRQRLLAKAREGDFDLMERAGLAGALILTVIATRYSSVELTISGRFTAILANAIVALPILFVLGGPFYLRRTRRHLQQLMRDAERQSDRV